MLRKLMDGRTADSAHQCCRGRSELANLDEISLAVRLSMRGQPDAQQRDEQGQPARRRGDPV
jgi:hypothetical protein